MFDVGVSFPHPRPLHHPQTTWFGLDKLLLLTCIFRGFEHEFSPPPPPFPKPYPFLLPKLSTWFMYGPATAASICQLVKSECHNRHTFTPSPSTAQAGSDKPLAPSALPLLITLYSPSIYSHSGPLPALCQCCAWPRTVFNPFGRLLVSPFLGKLRRGRPGPWTLGPGPWVHSNPQQ